MNDPSHKLDVLATPVVAEWVDTDGRTRYLSTGLDSEIPVTFDMTFDALTKSAFFRLRVPFFTKMHSKVDNPVFVFIPPERVATLTAEQPDALPEDVREQLGTDVIRLRLYMNEPADFVVPLNETLPKNKVNGDVLCIADLLARGTIITLYVAKLSKEQLQPLCDAVCHGDVRSLEQYADLTTLYSRKGGRVCIDVENSEAGKAGPSKIQPQASAMKTGEEVLPPYPAPMPPTAAVSSYADSSRKRRRHSSGAGTEEAHTGMLKRLMVEMFGELGQEIHALKDELQGTKQELRETQQELRETKQELREFQDALPEVRSSCIQYVDQSIEDAKEEIDDRIMDMVKETDAQIGVLVDEDLTSAKLELQDFVTDRLRSTSAEIVQRVRDAEVYLDIRLESP
ncbi:hypothetical protein VM1G_10430 [Cytospora mali]|uniref:Uncharacterized protein n=1 Tax=Cytospora mali TaxID=578113 RepID=A0A194VHT6_CYTMA|nr:hypothetical protein VM1G_10430 [Valsa mali]